jgi:hypothetical protein
MKKFLKKVFSKSSIPIVKKGLTIMVFLGLFINLIYITLIYFDRNYEFNILNKTYIAAVYPGQDINDVLSTNILVIEEPKVDHLTNQSQIITFGNYNTTEYWVHDVVNINQEQELVSFTYDGLVSSVLDIDDITGEYVKEANLFGSVYFAATFYRGYILLIIAHMFIFSIYYFSVYPHKEHEDEKITG